MVRVPPLWLPEPLREGRGKRKRPRPRREKAQPISEVAGKGMVIRAIRLARKLGYEVDEAQAFWEVYGRVYG